MAKLRLGALEAGGTKMVCAIGDENGTIYEQVSIPTTTPKETIPKMIAYFRDKGIDALGIACFGPIELDRDSEKYGYITTTPKLAWRDCNIVGQMQEALHCPVGFDTDVNGSVLGEVTFGQAQGKKCVMYLTIGTGVGGGIYSNGELHHGMLHPETRSGLQILMPEDVLIIRIVWKVWRQALPSKNAGAGKQWTWQIARKYGSWRQITLLRR